MFIIFRNTCCPILKACIIPSQQNYGNFHYSECWQSAVNSFIKFYFIHPALPYQIPCCVCAELYGRMLFVGLDSSSS